MSNKIKNKIGSFVASILERSVLGFFGKVRKNTIDSIKSIPDNMLKVYYGYILLIFLVTLLVSGIIVICGGSIMILVTLFDKSVDKILWSGIFLTILGLIFLFIGAFILTWIGRLLHSSITKKTDDLVKKIEK